MIKVERPSEERLQEIKTWDIWEKEPSEFPHYYEESEYFYFLQGQAEIADKNGKITHVKKGDLVTIDKGEDTFWTVRETVRKHFLFF